MTAATECLVLLCTCPDRGTGLRLAEAAVTGRLAACVNLLPGVESVYEWNGALERAGEVLLLAKTTRAAYVALETLWRELHPYELPELLAVPVESGSEAYLQWIERAVSA
ncbi:MAG: divalent-cation tolerance protein CutA [Gammaproteobacteria bacterium]